MIPEFIKDLSASLITTSKREGLSGYEMKPKYSIQCVICKKSFIPRTKLHVSCSPECRIISLKNYAQSPKIKKRKRQYSANHYKDKKELSQRYRTESLDKEKFSEFVKRIRK